MSYHWIKLFDNEEAMLNNIPKGKAQSLTIKGNKICIAHSGTGVYAVSDRCPHNGASLSQGFCNENDQIVCPMHRYPFDLKTGKATAGLAYGLITYPIKTEPDGIYIGIKAKWWEL
jgi:3-phenylpropionate/trans-cinnamate dioxygenase ferredoxin subunit